MNYKNNVFALVPAMALVAVLCGLLLINSCEKENSVTHVYEPITVVQPDSVIAKIKQGEPSPVEIKFVTDRPIVYAMGLYSIDSTNFGEFNLAESDTMFLLQDSIPKENKKSYSGEFNIDNAKPGYKVRIKVMMQALGNSGVPDAAHYYEKYLRFDIVK